MTDRGDAIRCCRGKVPPLAAAEVPPLAAAESICCQMQWCTHILQVKTNRRMHSNVTTKCILSRNRTDMQNVLQDDCSLGWVHTCTEYIRDAIRCMQNLLPSTIYSLG